MSRRECRHKRVRFLEASSIKVKVTQVIYEAFYVLFRKLKGAVISRPMIQMSEIRFWQNM